MIFWHLSKIENLIQNKLFSRTEKLFISNFSIHSLSYPVQSSIHELNFIVYPFYCTGIRKEIIQKISKSSKVIKILILFFQAICFMILLVRLWLYFSEIFDISNLDLDNDILEVFYITMLYVLFSSKNNEFDLSKIQFPLYWFGIVKILT